MPLYDVSFEDVAGRRFAQNGSTHWPDGECLMRTELPEHVHCTHHERYHDGCYGCRVAAQDYERSQREQASLDAQAADVEEKRAGDEDSGADDGGAILGALAGLAGELVGGEPAPSAPGTSAASDPETPAAPAPEFAGGESGGGGATGDF